MRKNLSLLLLLVIAIAFVVAGVESRRGADLAYGIASQHRELATVYETKARIYMMDDGCFAQQVWLTNMVRAESARDTADFWSEFAKQRAGSSCLYAILALLTAIKGLLVAIFDE